MRKLLVLILAMLVALPTLAQPPVAAKAYRGILTREAHAVDGLNAPIPMFAAQIEQESGWKPGITAWDNGRGLAQFMDGTASMIADTYPELGAPAPYNPTWAMRALIRYDHWLAQRVQGADDCQRRASALKAYNAGLGTVQYAQRNSETPGTWFEATEFTHTRQSAANFEASRMYPRWILMRRQPGYAAWGQYTCEGVQ